MDRQRLARIVRQNLTADGLLGLSFLPVRPGRPTTPPPPSTPDLPAAPSPTPPVRQNAAASQPTAETDMSNELFTSPMTGAALSAEEKRERLAKLEAQVAQCTKCALWRTRTQTVFARGSEQAPIVFVGEAPGEDEDAQGKPFVGRAGKLLDRIITAMKLREDEYYICNILKCRPPNNRTPAPDEVSLCWPYLQQQLDILAPQVIVALGAPAAHTLLNTRIGIGKLRGTWHQYEGVKVMPTYHTAYLLRAYTPENRRKVWEDMQKVMAAIGRPLPP